MHWLKQSTSCTLRVGPFVDATDGVTPETGVSLAAADEAELLKHTGSTVSLVASPEPWAAISGSPGWYNLTLSTSHTDTLGMLTVVVQDASVCLPVFTRCMVVPANVYDSMFSTDKLQVDAVEINSTAASASNLAYSASTMLYGTVDGTGTQSQTQIETTATSEATANHFVGRAFFFIDGALALQAAKITAYSYTGGRGRFTVEQMTDTPGSGDKFIIV